MRLLVMYVNYLENYFIVQFVYLFTLNFHFHFFVPELLCTIFIQSYLLRIRGLYCDIGGTQPAPHKSAERKYHENLHGNRMATLHAFLNTLRIGERHPDPTPSHGGVIFMYVCLVFYDSRLRSGHWVTVGKIRIGIANEANGD